MSAKILFLIIIAIAIVTSSGLLQPVQEYKDKMANISINSCQNKDTPLNCNTTVAREEVKRFYEQNGPWSGEFQMDVMDSQNRNANQCDVNYLFRSNQKGLARIKGEDSRTFTFNFDKDSCRWMVVKMGSKHSGTKADEYLRR